MPRVLMIIVLAITALFLSGPSLDACGDKLLALGRGVRFQNVVAEYPASILHYMDPVKSSTVSDSQLRSSLGQAGHRLHSVRSAKEFEEALRTGKYDIALIDFAEAPDFEAMIQAAASKPLLLPSVESGKKTDLAAAKRQYGLALKAPARVAHLLDTLDDAMEMKLKR